MAVRASVVTHPFVEFCRPSIGDAEIAAVVESLRSGWLSCGPRVKEFEAAFAAFVGARHAVAVNACTSALHLSLLAAGIGPGDEVITTPLTFCATVNAILHAGATPVFADIDRATMNIDPAAVSSAITPRTRALVPVHFGGRPVDLRALRALARRHDLVVVEDAAHCVDGAVGSRRIGAISPFTCFSFYATKNLTTGEGGMITTPSREHADWLRIACLQGMSADAWSRYSPTGGRLYDVVMAGYKCNMTDLQAALGLQQLRRLPELQARREVIWRRYDGALKDLPVTCPLEPAAGTVHARHLYTILVDPRTAGHTRDSLRTALLERGVGTSVHFTALHLFPYYADRLRVSRGMFPNAEFVSDRTLSLPFSPALSDADIDHVIESLQASLS